MEAFIESGMELRRDDIELGRKLERERITRVLEEVLHFDSEDEKRNLVALITGEQK